MESRAAPEDQKEENDSEDNFSQREVNNEQERKPEEIMTGQNSTAPNPPKENLTGTIYFAVNFLLFIASWFLQFAALTIDMCASSSTRYNDHTMNVVFHCSGNISLYDLNDEYASRTVPDIHWSKFSYVCCIFSFVASSALVVLFTCDQFFQLECRVYPSSLWILAVGFNLFAWAAYSWREEPMPSRWKYHYPEVAGFQLSESLYLMRTASIVQAVHFSAFYVYYAFLMSPTTSKYRGRRRI